MHTSHAGRPKSAVSSGLSLKHAAAPAGGSCIFLSTLSRFLEVLQPLRDSPHVLGILYSRGPVHLAQQRRLKCPPTWAAQLCVRSCACAAVRAQLSGTLCPPHRALRCTDRALTVSYIFPSSHDSKLRIVSKARVFTRPVGDILGCLLVVSFFSLLLEESKLSPLTELLYK